MITFIILLVLSTLISVACIGGSLPLLGVEFRWTVFIGIIGLIGIVIRNGMMLAECLRSHKEDVCVEPGKRYLIYLLSVFGAASVILLVINMSPLWCPVGVLNSLAVILFLLLLIVMLPFKSLYVYKKVMASPQNRRSMKKLRKVIAGLYLFILLFCLVTCYLSF